MIRRLESADGIAAFRQGRSLCLRLHRTLDGDAARRAVRLIRHAGDALRLRLECSALTAVEPAAARDLAEALLGWAAGADGRAVLIHNLDPGLQDRIAWHPLRPFLDPDELLFLDPDRAACDAMSASRH